jgi:hypothetical protein
VITEDGRRDPAGDPHDRIITGRLVRRPAHGRPAADPRATTIEGDGGMQARRGMRAAMVVALGAAAVLPALAASAGSASASTPGPDPALSGTPNLSWWGTNGRVMDILRVGNRV